MANVAVATTVGAETGGYGVSGTIEVGDSAGFSMSGHVPLSKNKPQRAVLVRPSINASMTYTCRQQFVLEPYYGGKISYVCSHAMDAAWTGEVTTSNTAYRGCTDGAARPIVYSNHQHDVLSVSAGRTFTAKGGFKTPFVNADFSTTYGAGTSYSYHLNQTKAQHRFCVGGNGSTVQASAALYISPAAKPSTGSCRRANPKMPAPLC